MDYEDHIQSRTPSSSRGQARFYRGKIIVSKLRMGLPDPEPTFRLIFQGGVSRLGRG
jgi:hypothetical protein